MSNNPNTKNSRQNRDIFEIVAALFLGLLLCVLVVGFGYAFIQWQDIKEEVPAQIAVSTPAPTELPIEPEVIIETPEPYSPPPAIETTPSPSEELGKKVFGARSFRLGNGMNVVVIENHRAPIVTHMVWYAAGAADEPHGKSGIAHFLEHLMFKGSGDLAPGEFSKKVKMLGGNDNAFTSSDYTAYFQSVASEHLPTVMKMEAGRMRGLRLSEEEILSERQVILEERRQRTENDPGAKLGEQIMTALLPNHPYGTPIIGWAHEMAELSLEDAQNFYDQWYAPNNATLIVSGDITGEEVLALAEEHYGILEPVDVPERIWSQTPPLPGQTHLVMNDKVVQQPVLHRAYTVPSYNQNKKASLALQVFEELFGANQTSQLYRSLVVDQKIATNVSIYYQSNALETARLWIYAIPAEGAYLPELEGALDHEIRTIIAESFTQEDVDGAIKRLQAEAIFARDSLQGPAMVFGQALTTGASIEDIEYWPTYIAEITAQDVADTVTKYLNPDDRDNIRAVTGYVLPAPKQQGQANNEEGQTP